MSNTTVNNNNNNNNEVKVENKMENVVLSTNMYKGAETVVGIKGFRYTPVVIKDENAPNYKPRTIKCASLRLAKEATKEYSEYCRMYQALPLPRAAKEKVAYNVSIGNPDYKYGQALYSEFWATILSGNLEHLIIYCDKIKTFKLNGFKFDVMGIIKQALTHGIKVTLFCPYVINEADKDGKWEFKAVNNEYINPLNQNLQYTSEEARIELLKIKESTTDIKWRRVEAELAVMTGLTYKNNLEHNGEDRYFAQLYTVRDLIDNNKALLPWDCFLDRVMNDPEYRFKLATIVRLYSKAYGLDDIKTDDFKSTNESFIVYDPNFKKTRPGYAGNEKDPYEEKILAAAQKKSKVTKVRPVISRHDFKAHRERNMIAKRDVDIVQLFQQFMQIQWYELNGGLEVWGTPEWRSLEDKEAGLTDYVLGGTYTNNYTYCEHCGAPVNIGMDTLAVTRMNKKTFEAYDSHYDSLDGERYCNLCGKAPKRTGLVYAGLFDDCVEVDITNEDYDLAPLTEVSEDWNFVYKSNKPNLQVELTGEQFTTEEAMGIRAGFNAEDTRERLSKLNDVSPKTCGKEVSIHADEDWWLQQYSTIFNCKCREQSLSGWDIYKARHRK